MLSQYKTVYAGGRGEIVEKKSRFIASVFPVSTEEEAAEIIEKVKKEFWDGRHNCWAYVIGEEFQNQRCSDDKEPSGTAGKPILDVIMGQGLHNVLVVVTRYFGGTLLGTGGLVRAYSGATKEGLALSTIITKIYGVKLNIYTDYTGLGKIQYILGERHITVLDSVYGEQVEVQVIVPETEEKSVIAEIVEGTNGKAEIRKDGACYFAEVDGQIKLF